MAEHVNSGRPSPPNFRVVSGAFDFQLVVCCRSATKGSDVIRPRREMRSILNPR